MADRSFENERDLGKGMRAYLQLATYAIGLLHSAKLIACVQLFSLHIIGFERV